MQCLVFSLSAVSVFCIYSQPIVQEATVLDLVNQLLVSQSHMMQALLAAMARSPRSTKWERPCVRFFRCVQSSVLTVVFQLDNRLLSPCLLLRCLTFLA